MRIAQIVASLEARHGGPSRSVLGLSSGLAALGHDVALLATDPQTNSVEQPATGLAVRRFPRQWPESITVSSALRRHLLTTPYDLVHEHGLWLRPLHYATTAAREHGVPLVISPRGMMSAWSWTHHRWKKAFAARWIHPGAFTQAAGWHATSHEEADDIRRLGFKQPVCVAPNGVALPDPATQAAARSYWLERCPELASRRVALFYSRFHAKKRILELIDLWAETAPSDWLLLAVGIPEGYTVAALTEHAAQRGLADRVKIFDGTAAPSPYAAASLFLLPTHSENFGLTIAEALANGLPVVTTDQTPWQGLAANGAGHCVAWPDFPRTLGAALRETPVALQAQGARARAWMGTDFTWEKSAATLLAFYRELTTRQP